MPEMSITSPYVHSRVDSNAFNIGKPMPESTLIYDIVDFIPPVRVFGFGLKIDVKRRAGRPCFNCICLQKVFIFKIILDFSASKTKAVVLDCVSKAALQLRFYNTIIKAGWTDKTYHNRSTLSRWCIVLRGNIALPYPPPPPSTPTRHFFQASQESHPPAPERDSTLHTSGV